MNNRSLHLPDKKTSTKTDRISTFLSIYWSSQYMYFGMFILHLETYSCYNSWKRYPSRVAIPLEISFGILISLLCCFCWLLQSLLSLFHWHHLWNGSHTIYSQGIESWEEKLQICWNSEEKYLCSYFRISSMSTTSTESKWLHRENLDSNADTFRRCFYFVVFCDN